MNGHVQVHADITCDVQLDIGPRYALCPMDGQIVRYEGTDWL